MPPKRRAPAKKKESPPPSESEIESEEEDLESDIEPESPKPKKAKTPVKPKAPPKPKAAPVAKKPKAAPAKPAAKKETAPKKETKKAAPKAQEAEKPAPPADTLEKKPAAKSGSKHLIIEHCKQCNSFKQRALKIQDLVKASAPDVEVTINPEKPRKGCFEIREAGPDGKVFLSLTGLVRPFPKLKALNLEETAQDVIAQIT